MTLTIAETLDEVLANMAGGARPIAGGTDLVVGARQGKIDLPESLVAIDRVSELATIASGPDEIRLGSGVTHARLMTEPIVVERLSAIADAAALVGSPATRNIGTLGGNVMNGSRDGHGSIARRARRFRRTHVDFGFSSRSAR